MSYLNRDIPHALYRMFSTDGRLLYVGCTFNPFQRFKSHEGVKPWVTDAASVTIEWFPNKEAARKAEESAIEAEAPEWNVHGKSSPKHSIGRYHPAYDRDDRSTWSVEAKRTYHRSARQGEV